MAKGVILKTFSLYNAFLMINTETKKQNKNKHKHKTKTVLSLKKYHNFFINKIHRKAFNSDALVEKTYFN